MIIFPTLRSSPAFEVGMPVFRAIFCFVWVIPTARFHENDKPGIFILNINYGCKKLRIIGNLYVKRGCIKIVYFDTTPAKLLCRHFLFAGEKSYQFTDPENERRGSDNDQPVENLKRLHIEEFAAEGYDKNLTYKDNQSDEAELSATLQIEGGLTCSERTGVEHVPELQEYEDRKEEGFLIFGKGHVMGAVVAPTQTSEVVKRRDVKMLEYHEQCYEQCEEYAAHSKNRLPHRLVDDKIVAISRLLLHHTL